MTRVEHIGNATLYLGDCRDILLTLGKVDAIVTDPPYGLNRVKSGHKVITRLGGVTNDDRGFDPAQFLTLGRHQIFWGANHFSSRLPDTGMGNGHPRWLMWLKHDHSMFGKRSTAPFELAWCSMQGADRAFRLIWDGSIKQGIGANQEHIHPVEKPVELMEWCIEILPSDCIAICDPFMGSGTTGVACARLGRNFIGIEIEPKYFDIACQRIDEALRQPDLFLKSPASVEQTPLL